MLSFKNILIGLGIAILFAFVVSYGINTFYPRPEYDDFCNINYPNRIPTKEPADSNCSFNQSLNQQRQECYNQKATPVSVYDENGCEVSVTCDTCSIDYENAQIKYSRIVFIAAGLAGLIAIAVGSFLFSVEAVGAGLMGGGIISIIYGNAVYWRNLDNLFRFIILLISLIIVIFIGLKINKQVKNH